jgi:outer membrane lipoprotein SlyB
MKLSTLSIVIIATLLLTACASQTGWRPTVDAYGNPNSGRLNQDMWECQELASHASGGVYKETAIGAGVGGLIGAAGGAAIGAITGSPGTGAAIGAAVGGIGGAAKQGLQSEDQYKNAYNSCLRQRGHRVLQ